MQCVICGCSDQHACDGGCFWVFREPVPICSACAFKAIAEQATGLDEETRFEIGEQLVNLADRIHPEYDAQVAEQEEAMGMGDGGFDPSNGLRDDDPIYQSPRIWRPGDPL